MKAYIFTVLAILLFEGCTYTVYHPIPPKTQGGIECVKICEQNEYRCSLNEQEYKERCRRKNDKKEHIYQNCIKHNHRIENQIRDYCKNSKYQKQCIEDQRHVYKKLNRLKKCILPKNGTCYGIDLDCDVKYKQCFINCGGSYYEEQKEWF